MTHTLRPLTWMVLIVSVWAAGCRKPAKWRPHDPDASSVSASSQKPAQPNAPRTDPALPLHQRTYAIVVDRALVHTGTTAGVVTWDFADEKNPKRVASLSLEGSVQRLGKVGESSLLAVATGPTGVAFVDTSSIGDKKLTLVNQHPWSPETRNGCHSAWHYVNVEKGTGYVACGGAGVARINHEDPVRPVIDMVLSVDGYVRDLVVLDESSGVPKPAASSKKVAAAAGLSGLAIVDFGAAAPKRSALVDVGGEARAVAVSGGYAYVAAGAAGLVVVDVRKPDSPTVVGRLRPKSTDMARGISMSGQHALLCLGESGLVIIDIADPAQPRELGRFDPDRALNRVVPDGKRLFAANDADGVAILDIADPSKPVQVYPVVGGKNM